MFGKLSALTSKAAAAAPSLPALPAASGLLNAAKGAASKIPSGNLLKAAASGNIKGALASAANSAKAAAANAAANVAVGAAASQVPGGEAVVGLAKKFGIPSTTLLSSGVGIAGFFQTMDTKTMLILGGIAAIFLLILIGMIIFFTQKKTSSFQNVRDTSILQGVSLESTASALGKQVKGLSASLSDKVKGLTSSLKLEGFADATGTSPHIDDVKLVNIQPLTVKQAGFLGPLDAGVFQEATAVKNTLNAGVRTFLFQIDYHEDEKKDPALFPKVKEPCLLYRDERGTLTSTNAGSIQKMSQALADLAFSERTPSNTDPIVIILYGARVPYDPVTDPKGYLAYCTKIATQLKPLTPYHLGMMTNGDYHRQALQGQLFTTPFASFEKKVIIISNFDTTLYRNVTKMGLAPYAPSDDLDYWTHAQIFKDDPGLSSTAPTLGVTTVAPPTLTPRAKIYSLDTLRSVLAAGEAAISAWATKNKSVFTIVMPSAMMNPTYEEIDIMNNKLGLNVLPFDFFSFDVDDTKRRLMLWKSNTWNLRPVALRVGSKV
jgi:hypothetical protein